MPSEIPKIELKQITTLLRPPRKVVLVNIDDPDWQHICNRVIEWYSQMWGGSYNLIIPTDGKNINEVFWKIMELYSPDYIYFYIKTLKDIEVASPEKALAIKNAKVEKYLRDYPEEKRENAEKMFDNYFNDYLDQIDEFKISNDLKKELVRRLNPFHNSESIETSIKYFRFGEGAHHEDTSVQTILSDLTDDKRRVVEYEAKDLPLSLQLWLSSFTGKSKFIRENYEKKSKPLELRREMPFVDWQPTIIKENALKRIFEIAYDNKRKLEATPFFHADYGLSRYTKKTKDYKINPITLIVGDSLSDFCLFYSLSKLQTETYWIPKHIIDEASNEKNSKEFILKFILRIYDEIYESGNENRKVVLTSFSLDQSELNKVKSILHSFEYIAENQENSGIKLIIETPFNVQENITNPLIVFEYGNTNNVYIEQFIDNVSINILKTPKPRIFQELRVFENRWITDIEIRSDRPTANKDNGYLMPPKPSLSKTLFLDQLNYDTSTIRFTRDGVSFYCPTMGFISFRDTIDDILVKPRLQLLNPIEIFETLFGEIGYSIKLSDKGRYTSSAVNLFGSLKDLSIELQKEEVINIFNCFIDKSEGRKRNVPGCFINGRAYLNYEDIKTFFDDPISARKIIDNYLLKNIFLRGVILQCGTCRQVDWYDIGEVDQKFICHRCYEKQVYVQENWRKGEELPFYYKLNEMIYQGYKHNMIVPVLSLNVLSGLADRCFVYLSEVELRKDPKQEKADIEIDLACIIDGEIYLGEAKKKAEIPSKLALLHKIIDDLSGKFIFATLSDELDINIKNKILDYKWKKNPIIKIRADLINIVK